MKKAFALTLSCVGLIFCGLHFVDTQSSTAKESSSEPTRDSLIAESIQHRYVESANGTYITQYVGFERGSRRVVRNLALKESGFDYVLRFDVKFCEGFDFARGGKLHGLGPRQPVAGGNPVEPHRWSARLMWRTGGTLQTYVYHQDMQGRYGDTQRAPDFAFEPGRYYSLSMRVRLNDPIDEANGFIEVAVDGDPLIKHEGLRFRGSEGSDALIHNFMFNTFHGGNNESWAPRDASGAFKNDCAYFKDIQVHEFAV